MSNFKENQDRASQGKFGPIKYGQFIPSQFAAKQTPTNTGVETRMRATVSMHKRQQEANVRQHLQRVERETKAMLMTDMSLNRSIIPQRVPLEDQQPVVTLPTTGPYIIYRDKLPSANTIDGLTTVNDILKYGVGYGAETSTSAGQLFMLSYYKTQVAQEGFRLTHGSMVGHY